MRLRREATVLVLACALGACGPQRFGRVVTAVTVSPDDPHLLIVRTCDLVNTSKADLDQIGVGKCKRIGIRRSAIRPVPVADARVLAHDNRIVTGFAERDGGGAIVTTCRLGKSNDKWALLDCADTEISTAPLDATPAAAPPPVAPVADPPPPPTAPGATP